VCYYACQRKQKAGAVACAGKYLNRDQAEAAVVARDQEAILTPEHFRTLFDLVNAELRTQADGAGAELQALDRQWAECRRRRDRLYEALESGAVEVGDLAPRLKEVNARMKELEASRQAVADRAGGARQVRLSDAEVADYVLHLKELMARGDLDERRAFLKAWVRRIVVDGRTPGTPARRAGGASAREGSCSGKEWLRSPSAERITSGKGRRVGWLVGEPPIHPQLLKKEREERKREEKKKVVARPAVPLRDRWLAMIDGKTIVTKADLARHLGVSRARVTQVLGAGTVHAVHADPPQHPARGRRARSCAAAPGVTHAEQPEDAQDQRPA